MCESTVASFQQSAYTGDSLVGRLNLACAEDEYCSAMLGRYVNDIHSLSNEGNAPTTICRALHYCVADRQYLTFPHPGPDTYEENAAPLASIGFSSSCGVCQTVLQLIAGEIKGLDKAPSPQEIRALLDNACNMMPSMFKASCNTALNQNGRKDAIVAALTAHKSAADTCIAINLCNAPSNSLPYFEKVLEEEEQEVEVAQNEAAVDTLHAMIPPPSRVDCIICRTLFTSFNAPHLKFLNQTAMSRVLKQACNSTGPFTGTTPSLSPSHSLPPHHSSSSCLLVYHSQVP
eukprot:TRINITY_DN1565_c0_g1_i4.p1 TRINITY_DN1565_c0_g1~~TRINITY_DN1565_c0_g1_i4.p1  ORF type:complete len:339 (+),score=89.97 TRINITY_DN1565_c0_g1_i4:153-1019(+)